MAHDSPSPYTREPQVYQAEWISKRLAGKPLANQQCLVETPGRIQKTNICWSGVV